MVQDVWLHYFTAYTLNVPSILCQSNRQWSAQNTEYDVQ